MLDGGGGGFILHVLRWELEGACQAEPRGNAARFDHAEHSSEAREPPQHAVKVNVIAYRRPKLTAEHPQTSSWLLGPAHLIPPMIATRGGFESDGQSWTKMTSTAVLSHLQP